MNKRLFKIHPSTRRRQGFGGQAAVTTEPDEVSGRTDWNE